MIKNFQRLDMDTLKATLHYLLHLEWTVKTQHECRFCDESNFKNIVFQVCQAFSEV